MQDERLFIKGQRGISGEGSRVLLGISEVLGPVTHKIKVDS